MSEGIVALALVPARAGSKGLPHKNRERLDNRLSLVEHALAVAKASGVCDLYAVTSDDPILLAQARRMGAVAVERPPRLATDSAKMLDAVRHAVKVIEDECEVRCDPIILVDPTAPLRSPLDIRTAVELNRVGERPNVFSASEIQDSEWLFTRTAKGDAKWAQRDPRERRQEQEPMYVPNPVVYVFTRERLNLPWHIGAVAFVTPPHRSVEIDDENDLRLVRYLMQYQGGA